VAKCRYYDNGIVPVKPVDCLQRSCCSSMGSPTQFNISPQYYCLFLGSWRSTPRSIVCRLRGDTYGDNNTTQYHLQIEWAPTADNRRWILKCRLSSTLNHTPEDAGMRNVHPSEITSPPFPSHILPSRRERPNFCTKATTRRFQKFGWRVLQLH
jgi:hypothetical protein